MVSPLAAHFARFGCVSIAERTGFSLDAIFAHAQNRATPPRCTVCTQWHIFC